MKHLERAIDGQNQWWKYPVNFIAGLFAMNIIGGIPLTLAFIYVAFTTKTPFENINISNLSQYGISHNLNLVLLLFPFAVGLATTWLLLKPLHKRSLTEVINGTSTIRWKRYLIGFGCWFVISAIYLLADFILSPGIYKVQFEPGSFLVLLIITLVFIPIQTAYEEVFFRGYLTQWIGGTTRNRWLSLMIPAILFGLMHSANPEVKQYGFWISMAQYISFGLIFGVITLLDDGIELSMGVHAANNLFLCLFVTNDSSALVTSAVLKQTTVNPVKETIVLITLGIALVIILKSIFKWDFKMMNQKVVSEVNVD